LILGGSAESQPNHLMNKAGKTLAKIAEETVERMSKN
jgi:hypothetical protein